MINHCSLLFHLLPKIIMINHSKNTLVYPFEKIKPLKKVNILLRIFFKLNYNHSFNFICNYTYHVNSFIDFLFVFCLGLTSL